MDQLVTIGCGSLVEIIEASDNVVNYKNYMFNRFYINGKLSETTNREQIADILVD